MSAKLIVETGSNVGMEISLEPGEVKTVGSGEQADVRLSDPSLLVRHAALMYQADGLSVVDLGGVMGTTVNGKRTTPRQPTLVGNGDSLKIGDVLLSVTLSGAPLVSGLSDEELIPADEYEVLGELGRGGMGRVLSARRRSDGASVAIKILLPSILPGSPIYRRFQLEAEIGQRIRSPYVVAVHELRVVEGRACVVMELVEGPSCEELLAQQGRLSPADVARIGSHVAHGLAAACAVGVVHRDVKPGNILLDQKRGIAKLGDFGIAKDMESSEGVTASGTGLGTVAYMAPEQLSEAKHADTQADLYSLGATLYHLLTGQVAYGIKDIPDLVAAEDKDLTPVSSLVPCPPELDGLIQQLMAKMSWERPQSPAEVARQLGEIHAKLATPEA